jgi:hypothetical protein
MPLFYVSGGNVMNCLGADFGRCTITVTTRTTEDDKSRPLGEPIIPKSCAYRPDPLLQAIIYNR